MCVSRLLAATVLYVLLPGAERQGLCAGGCFPLPGAWLRSREVLPLAEEHPQSQSACSPPLENKETIVFPICCLFPAGLPQAQAACASSACREMERAAPHRPAAGPGLKHPASWRSGNTIKIKRGREEQKANDVALSGGEDQRLIASSPAHALRDAVPGRGKIQRRRAAPSFL